MYSLSLLPSLIGCEHTEWTYAWACYCNCCINTAVEILFSTHFCHVPAELWHLSLLFPEGLLGKVCLLNSAQSVRSSSGEVSTRYIVCWVSSECVCVQNPPQCLNDDSTHGGALYIFTKEGCGRSFKCVCIFHERVAIHICSLWNALNSAILLDSGECKQVNYRLQWNHHSFEVITLNSEL